MNLLAHLVTDDSVLWYPIVALAGPVVLVAVLTRVDRIRHGEAATHAQEAGARRR